MIPRRALLAAAALAWTATAASVLAQSLEPAGVLKAAIAAACDDAGRDAGELAQRLPGDAVAVSDEPLEFAGTEVGWRRGFHLGAGGLVELTRFAPGGRLRRLGADFLEPSAQGPRPLMTAIAGPDCLVVLGRRLVYGAGAAPETIEFLDGELEPTGESEPLNPAVPAGRDPGGVAVALVDSGVNYLLPEIAGALARDDQGQALGYDFWDLDDRPFDSHPVRSPFFPVRHGTRVASVLLGEAPGVRIVPYRYPRPDLSRMAELVERAAAAGVRIVTISLGSNLAEPWRPFAIAAAAHPEMLFVVSAGNDGRDIDAEPVYPAALPLDNMLVVTSADGFGEPAPGSNWGKRSVDLLVPAEELPVLTFTGEVARSSGSSFAAPRIAALAARLLARHPELTAAELKDRVFARARMSDAGGPPKVSQGLIADPSSD